MKYSPSPSDTGLVSLSTTRTETSDGESSNSSLDGGSSGDDEISLKDSAPKTTPGFSRNSSNGGGSKRLLRRQSSMQEAGLHLTAGTVVSCLVVAFSLFLPFLLAPAAAVETYKFAFWKYDPELSHFDNTPWTYGTDYFLAASMLLLTLTINANHDSLHNAGWLSRGLLASYMFSVTAGGLAHQFYTTVEQRNTVSFRILWTVVVGTVTLASGFMGATGSELLRLDYERHPHQKSGLMMIPVIPDWFWIGYAVFVTGTVILGAFSCHRPACDIFIAGITQFVSTFYVIAILFAGLRNYKNITNFMRCAGCLGFILNAPLLPLYPILVQYTDWSLAAVNTLLHTWLLVAWSLQGLCLRHIGNAVVAEHNAAASHNGNGEKRD